MSSSSAPLTDEALRALLAHDRPKRQKVNPVCRECNARLDNGYCPNKDCEVDAPVPTFDCKYCGYCETPGRCVQSFGCPLCGAGTSELCREGTRLVGFHRERWELVYAASS
jgi:hypothetical protein